MSANITVMRTAHGIRVTGVRGYLGYTDTVILTKDDDIRTLTAWLQRDGDVTGAEVLIAVLTGDELN